MSGSKGSIADLGPGWDTHCHVFDPLEYPYPADVAYAPPRRTPAALMQVTPASIKSVIVMSVPEGDDTRQTLRAMETLTAGGRVARGTIVSTPDKLNVDRMHSLHSSGIRSIRFHIVRYKNDLQLLGADIERTAIMIHDTGVSWPIDMQLDFGQWLEIAPILERLHSSYGQVFVADHLFCCSPQLAQKQDPAIEQLLKLVRSGVVWVKLSGLDRYSQGQDAGFTAFETLLKRLLEARQGRGLMFGSDWPHVVMGPGSGTREDEIDIESHIRFIKATCDSIDRDAWQRVWHDNAETIYA